MPVVWGGEGGQCVYNSFPWINFFTGLDVQTVDGSVCRKNTAYILEGFKKGLTPPVLISARSTSVLFTTTKHAAQQSLGENPRSMSPYCCRRHSYGVHTPNRRRHSVHSWWRNFFKGWLAGYTYGSQGTVVGTLCPHAAVIFYVVDIQYYWLSLFVLFSERAWRTYRSPT